MSDALGMCRIEPKTLSKSSSAIPSVIRKSENTQAVSEYMKSKQLLKDGAANTINMKRTRSSMRLVRQCESCKTLFENAHICRNKPAFAKKPKRIENAGETGKDD